LIPGANGDMGENETAGLDPIFFFHHCFIDYTFWIWQRRNGFTDAFDIDETDPGAVYNLQNGPSPPAGADLNQPMSLETPLKPFPSTDGERIMITKETINIETDLGYTYGPGSLDQYASKDAAKANLLLGAEPDNSRIVHVAGLNRAKIKGSFAIAAYAEVDGVQQLVDVDPVLSRWSVEGCANCQSHLEATADFRVPADVAEKVQIRVHTRGGMLGGEEPDAASVGFVKGVAAPQSQPFTVEIR
jgi:tyrosinase